MASWIKKAIAKSAYLSPCSYFGHKNRHRDKNGYRVTRCTRCGESRRELLPPPVCREEIELQNAYLDMLRRNNV